jgi:hypothetical protein
MMFDVYHKKGEPTRRLAVLTGKPLPPNVNAAEWVFAGKGIHLAPGIEAGVKENGFAQYDARQATDQ